MSVEQRILVGVVAGDSDMKEAHSLLKREEKGEVVVVDGNGVEVKERDKDEVVDSFLLPIDMNKEIADEEQALQNVGTNGNRAVNGIEEKNGPNNEVNEADQQDTDEEIAEKVSENSTNEEFGVDGCHEYSVGDFVWGKIKGHPWWPGQIYDASSASDYAVKLKQEEKLLVAYFGDGTFAWCHPSQLEPFGDKFEEMAKQSSSNNFVNAVDATMDEVGRIVRLKMTCSCIREGKMSNLDRPYALNCGIKENILVPNMELDKLHIPHQMSDLLTNLMGIARNPGFSSLLDTMILKNWILAFYRSKGIYHLAAYSEPQLIEGLEDKEDDLQIGELLKKGPEEEEEEWITSSSPKPATLNVQKTKKKSMAEILDGEKLKEVAAPSRKPTHRGRPKRRRVAKLIESSPIIETVDSDIEVDYSGEEKANGFDLRAENGDAELKDSNSKGYVSRERKKSKYLSPPYTTPTLIEKASDRPHFSLKVSIFLSPDSNEEVSPKPKPGHGTKMSQMGEFLHLSAKDVLSEIQSLKLDPCFSRKTDLFPVIEEFLHLFRSSLFSDCGKPDEKAVGSYRKRKSDQIKNKDKSGDEKDPVVSSKKRKPDQNKNREKLETENEGSSDVKKENGELNGCRLMISFGPGSSLPSKEDLITLYSKFGPLNITETKMYYNNFCGLVSFERTSDAESALTSSKDCSPFGLSGNASFVLQPPSPKKKKASSQPIITHERKEPDLQEKNKAEFEFVQMQIKKMSAMLEKSPDGKLSEKMKSKLETKLKRVLEKMGCCLWYPCNNSAMLSAVNS